MRPLLILTTLLFASSVHADVASTNPACWETPRMTYERARPDDLERVRVRKIARAGAIAGEPSPDGSMHLAFTAPVTTARGASASMSIGGGGQGLLVLFVGARYMDTPSWVNDRLVHFRFFHTRLAGVDGVIDAGDGELVWVRALTEGTLAMQQAKADCATPEFRETEACRC